MLLRLAKLRARGVIARIGRPLVNAARTPGRVKRGLRHPIRRAAFLANIDRGKTLEIGPLNNPGLIGANVLYFDVLNQDELRAYAVKEGLNQAGCPHIDFVSRDGDLKIVDQTFASVYSSHAVEHQPDLVAHLQGVQNLLEANGRYSLAVPDKRFCFDHFNPETTLDDVLAAHRANRRVHTANSVREHRLGTTHNDSLLHWLKFHQRPASTAEHGQAARDDMARAEAGEYVDVHAWKFTPESFARIVRRLREDGLTSLHVSEIHDTGFGEPEFFAILQKD